MSGMSQLHGFVSPFLNFTHGCLFSQFFTQKSGILKRKDVSFLAPDGEELRNKRQLDKYLKNHPGSLMASDFDWISGLVFYSPAEIKSSFALISFKSSSQFLGIATVLYFLVFIATDMHVLFLEDVGRRMNDLVIVKVLCVLY
jgi:hypothetical protein